MTKTRLLLLWCLVAMATVATAQIALDESNSGNIFSSCSGTYTDDGGRSIYSSSYDTNNDGNPDFLCWTFCPTHPINKGVRLSFLEWDLHPSDEFRIRDGAHGLCSHVPASGLSPIIGTFTGHSPSQFDGSAGGTYAYGGGAWIESSPTNTSGCLTIEFRPNGDGNKGTGWEIAVGCLREDIEPSKIFISEYYNNCDGDMYIELFNPTNKKVNLDSFSLRRQSGTTFGSGANAYDLPDDYIQPYSTYLVCKSRINSTVKPACDATISSFGNGSWFSKIKCDEALGLFQQEFIIDQIGNEKKLPTSTSISVAGVSDAISNYTLIRKKDVICGSTDWAASGGTTESNSQWLLIPDGKFKNAGSHIFGNPKIFISEFYGRNKTDAYVEIYNGTGSNYNLNGLELILAEGSQDWGGTAPSGTPNYSGGWIQSGASARILPLSGSLSAGDVTVVANAGANPNILCQADLVLDGSTNRGQKTLSLADGNDAIGLFLNHVLIDVVGEPGSNRTHNLGRVNSATSHRVLVRTRGTRESNCDWSDSSAGVFPDWEVLNIGDFTYLGAHRRQPIKCFEQVIISEVVNTKNKIAIGIMNKSQSTLNLAKIKIRLGTTGTGWNNEYISFPNGSTLAPNTEFVVYQTLEGGFEDIPTRQKMSTNQLFNGPVRQLGLDDAIAIVQDDGKILDVFGDPNQQNNGIGYLISGLPNALAHNVLRRRSSITLGNIKPMDSFGTNRLNSEWILINNTSLNGFGEANTNDEVPRIQYRINELGAATCSQGGTIQIEVVGGTAPFRVFVNDVLREDGMVTNLTSGSHSLTIRDPYGVNHRTTFSYTAAEMEGLEVALDKIQDPSCSGSGVAEVVANQSALSYQWSNGVSTARNDQLGAGSHSVTVTSASGCEQVLSLQLESASSLAAALNGLPSRCGNESLGSVSANISGGSGNYSYLWSNGSTAAALENVSNGNYEVTITDGEGCTATAGTSLIGPLRINATATIAQPSCQSSIGAIALSVDGGSAPYTYNWNDTGFRTDNASISNLPGGAYSVIIRDANGCELTQNYILESASPINARVDVTKQVSCAGSADGQATVTTDQSDLRFLWEDGSTAATNTNLAAGTHEVLVTSASNCSVLLQVQIGESSDLDISILLDQPLTCDNSLGILSVRVPDANDVYQFAWNTGHVHAAISFVNAGVYEVAVTNSSGCSATQSITVEEPNCLTEAGKNTAAKVITTIMDPIKLNQVQFFPNPTTGLITVHDKNETFQPSLLAIYSAQGQLMQEIPLLDRQRQIDLSDYSKGMYIVKITRERSVGIQKIMVDGGR